MAEINHIIITGQSVAVTPNSPVLSGTQTRPTELTYFSGGARLALEKSNQWPERSLVDTAAPPGYYLNVRTAAVSGQPYTGIKKGTTTYTGAINNLAAGVTTSEGAGHTVVMRALHVIHGEADSQFGTLRAHYLANLLEWLNDYTTDCSALTGQTAPIVGIAHQVSPYMGAAPAHAVLDAHRTRDDWFCVGPIYHLNPTPHLVSADSFRLGEYHARVYRAVVIDEGTWEPVAPIGSERTSPTTATIQFSVPTAPLVIDTTGYPARTDYGFGCSDEDGTVEVTGVSVTDDDEVTLTFGREPGDEARITYGPPVSIGGNLRDSSTDESELDDAPLYNWCCYFDDLLGGDPTPPDPIHGEVSLFDINGDPVVVVDVNGDPVTIGVAP